MKIMVILIAGASAAMLALRWGTPEALAWTVAFCGWVPHCFSSTSTKNT